MSWACSYFFFKSFRFVLFRSVRSSDRTIVPKERRPALELGVFLLFLNRSVLFRSVRSCDRTIVPQERRAALELGVFLLFLNRSVLFRFVQVSETR